MIDWTDDLLAQIEAASRGALSYPGTDGYPVVLPLPLDFRSRHARVYLFSSGRKTGLRLAGASIPDSSLCRSANEE